ncbi:energy transducer TonB [Sphingobium fluviale]|nr:energy transducer TonB [Sphingobium fluviale]
MKAIGGIMLVAIALLCIGSAQADIPKGAPVTAPPPIPMAPPPALSKPAPPLPPTPKVRAKPAESPGTWINPDDYPKAALYNEMTGNSAFRLFIDPTGKVSHCQITVSSGFEVLDNATCERLIEHGKFTPARDGKGKLVADVWNSRVVWKMPFATPQPIREGTGIATFQINKLGVVTDCAVKVKSWDAETSQEPCWNSDNMPPLAGLEMRGYGEEPIVEVDMEWSSSFSSAGRDRLMQDRPGYQTRSLLVFRFEVNAEGRMTQCAMERQRGSEKLIHNICSQAVKQLYAPLKDATGTPVSTPGWIINRILRKLGP